MYLGWILLAFYYDKLVCQGKKRMCRRCKYNTAHNTLCSSTDPRSVSFFYWCAIVYFQDGPVFACLTRWIPTFIYVTSNPSFRIYKNIADNVKRKGPIFQKIFDFCVKYKLYWYHKGKETPIMDHLVFNKVRISKLFKLKHKQVLFKALQVLLKILQVSFKVFKLKKL